MHDVSVLFIIEERPEDYVDECYSKSTQLKIYSNFISLISGANQWRSMEHPKPRLPPLIRRPPGRPHKNRRKEANETIAKGFKIRKKGGKLKHRKCGKPDHNVRICRGKVGGNNRLDTAAIVWSYMATSRSSSQTRRTGEKLPVSLLLASVVSYL